MQQTATEITQSECQVHIRVTGNGKGQDKVHIRVTGNGKGQDKVHIRVTGNGKGQDIFIFSPTPTPGPTAAGYRVSRACLWE